MTEKRDYYEVLGIKKTCTTEEIKTAYRGLVKQIHPDVCSGDKERAEEEFKQVSEAYEVLADPNKREMYDRYGHNGVSRSWGNDGFTWDDFSHAQDVSDLFGRDFFEGFFGGMGFGFDGAGRVGGAGNSRGASLRMAVPVTLEEAYKGAEKEIEVPIQADCPSCKGTGAHEGKVEHCTDCRGTGQLRSARQAGFAQFVTITTCPRCRGEGRRAKERCGDCRGNGRVPKREKISIKIPPGVDNGMRLRIPSKGEPGRGGGPRGDLYVHIQLEPHDMFKRDGNDLHIEVPVGFTQVVFGDKIDVPTLTGKKSLDIPEGTQSGTEFKLDNCGMPSVDGRNRGDLYIRVVVKTPKNLTPRQRELLRELANEQGHQIERGGIFRKFSGKK